MRSFDDILEEGKSRVIPGIKANDTVKRWRECINIIMNSLDEINGLYGGQGKRHHIDINRNNCIGCKKASFVVLARDISDRKKAIRFYKSGWKPIDKSYYCDDCS